MPVEVEHEVHVTVVVDVLDMAGRCAPPHVDLLGAPEPDRRVVDGRGVERVGRQQMEGDHAPSHRTCVAQHVDVDVERHVGREHALTGDRRRGRRQGGTTEHRRIERDRSLRVPEVREALEVVEEQRVERIVVDDVRCGLDGSGRCPGDIGEPEDESLGRLVLVIVDGRDREGQITGSALHERQGAGRHRHEVDAGLGHDRLDRIVDGDLVGILIAERSVERDDDVAGGAFGDVEGVRIEADAQLGQPGNADECDVVDEVRLRPTGAKRAEGPAVHLEAIERAVIGRSVADREVGEVIKRDLEVLPPGEVVGDVDAPPLGVVRRRSGVPVLEDVDEHRRPRVVAVEPEREGLALRPILSHPGVQCVVLEAVDETGETRDVEVDLHRRRGSGRQGDGRR